MASIESRDFDTPDETRTPDKATVELVNQIGRYTFKPGWRWLSAGRRHRQLPGRAVGDVVSGRLPTKHDDGIELGVKPGDGYRVAPGHDAWVVGDEPTVFVDFQGAANDAAR